LNFIFKKDKFFKWKYTSLIFLIFICILQMSYVRIANASLSTHRIGGLTQYDTSSDIAKEGWAQSDYVILAYGENFPDALAAAPLAKKYSAPILLTTSHSLPSVTKQSLIDLKVKNVFIVGGTAVIDSSVEKEVTDLGINVVRLAGVDRYDTAIEIAKQLDDVHEIAVVNGDDYSDALSISPIAAEKNAPIILVPRNHLTNSINDYLSSVSITKTYLVGNVDQVSEAVSAMLPNVERISGNDKYARNLSVLNRFQSDFNINNLFLATGNGFADALAGSAYAASKNAPILLVDYTYNQSTGDYLNSINSKIQELDILGGEVIMPSLLVEQYMNPDKTTPPTSTYTASEIAKKLSPSIVHIEASDSSGMLTASGSGYIVDTTGKIVTNYHLIKNADSAKIKTVDGRTYEVTKVLAYDSQLDLAILKIDATGLQPVTPGDSDGIGMGDKIYTIGNPSGIDNTMSDGIISSKLKEVNGESFIQISAPIAKGTSGGVLVNEQAEVIGTTTDGISNESNLNLATPANSLKSLLTQDINKTLAQLPREGSSIPDGTDVTDEDFTNSLNYLNSIDNLKNLDNSYSIMTIAGKSVRFIWKVNDYQSGTADLSIHGIMDPRDYANWISLINDNQKGNIMAYFAQLNNDIAKNYPGKSFSGSVLYRDYYANPTAQFSQSEVSFAGSGKWLVKHTIVSFYNTSNTSDPRVNVMDENQNQKTN
jgi:serine protease Do